NENIYHITGYTNEEIIGKTVGEVFFNDTQEEQKHLDEIRKAWRNKQSNQIETEVRTKSGGKIFLSANISPYFDDKANQIGTICIIQDITERKQQEIVLKETAFYLRESQRIAQIGSY